MELLEAFASNSSLAGALGASHALTGSWRTTVTDLARVEQLTSADIQRVRARVEVRDEGREMRERGRNLGSVCVSFHSVEG